MSQQLTPKQIAWRVAQDLPPGAYVRLGAGMPLLVPDYVAHGRSIVFERERSARASIRDAQPVDYCVLGAREVAQNGDLVEAEAETEAESAAQQREPDAAHRDMGICATTAAHVFGMTEYFAQDGRPKLVPLCALRPHVAGRVTRLYTDIAILDLREGKAWLREIIEGITLQVLQAETDVQLHVAPDLHLLQAPELP